MTSGTVNAEGGVFLHGKLAVVTGATRGIGAAIAMRLRSTSARVIAAVCDPAGRASEEIVAFIGGLAGPEYTCISGQNLPIDGGYTKT